MIDVAPRDRVLLLSLPEAGVIRRLAGQAREGIVVGLDEDDAVRDTRRALSDLLNVMLIPATADAIPWREDFFTVVIDASGEWPAREIARVLAPGGRVCVAREIAAVLTAAGLEEGEPAGDLAVFYKPPLCSPR